MMRFKLFEEYVAKYKVGDYIEFIDKDKFHIFRENNPNVRMKDVKDEDILEKGKITKVDWLDIIYYQVMKDDKSYIYISQNENLITRYLTDEEIEDFKMKLQTKKFNL